MRVYSYVVRYDFGFAPNPFHGWCSLATCKPHVRRGASVGDWVVGVGSAKKRHTGRLVYAMCVEEILTFDGYWADPRFERKKPDMRGSVKYRYGDNIYRRATDGRWMQADSRHSLDSTTPNPGHVATDTSVDAVLLSRTFTYWGGAGPSIPEELRSWDGADLARPGRDCAWKPYGPEMREAIVAWLQTLPAGIRARPADWPR